MANLLQATSPKRGGSTGAAAPETSDPPLRTSRVWPASVALFTAPWCPATTAGRTHSVPLRHAWLAHIAAALLTIMLLGSLGGPDPGDTSHPFALFIELLALFRDPKEAVLILGGGSLAIELALLLIALLLMPWGARDERLRDSYRHALRITWIHCGHIPQLVLLIGLTFVACESGHRRYWNAMESYIAPALAEIGAVTALAWICLCATAVAVELRMRVGRNLAQAAMRMASHHSILLVLWAIFAVVQTGVIVSMVLVNQTFQLWLMRRGLDRQLICTAILLAFNLPFGLWYYLLIRRATFAARFANR